MKNKWKGLINRTLSLLMTAAILFSLVPATVSAAVEANIDLEMTIRKGYSDGEPVLETVPSGEPFYVYLRYAMNAADTDDKYLGTTLRVELPEGVVVDPQQIQSNSHIAQDANGDPVVGVETIGGKTYVYFRFETELAAGSAASLGFQAYFPNMETVPNQDGFTFNAVVEGSIIPVGTGQPEGFEPVRASASVKVAASGNWGLFKSVDEQNSGLSADEQWYDLTYDLTVSLLKDGVDPAEAAANPSGDYYRSPDDFGRLEFDKFQLSDLLPQIGPDAVIEDEGAQLVEIGLYNDDGSKSALREGVDYTPVYDQHGDLVSVSFADGLYSKFGPGEYQAVEEGDSCNTRFYISVRYPAAAYASRIDEALKTHTFVNNATLVYSLVGDDADYTVTDSASSEIALRESGASTHSFTVQKNLSVGGREFPLDEEAVSAGYAPAVFSLWLDEQCTKRATQYDAATDSVSDSPDLTTDKNGQVVFDKLRSGTYYLKEERYDGFSLSAPASNPAKVVIRPNGKVSYFDGAQEKEAANGVLNFLNTADTDGFGILEFVKKGKDASGRVSALDGVQFELYKAENGAAAGSPVATKVSGMDGQAGYVRFDALEPGSYLLREVLTDPDQAAEYTPAQDILIEIRGNEIKTVTVGPEEGVLLNESGSGRFTLTKTDNKGNTLDGAVVRVYADTNNNGVYDSEDQPVTGELNIGSYSSGPVAAGRYFAVEISAPDGYKPLDAPVAFTVSAMTETPVRIENEKLGWLSVYKYGTWKGPDGTTQNAKVGLGGAQFEVYADENGSMGSTLLGTITTMIDQTGQPSYEGSASLQLAAGTYWLVETQAPQGYAVDPTPRKVTVARGDAADGAASGQTGVTIQDGHTVVSVDNRTDEDYARIQIQKSSALDGSMLSGVTFRIYADEQKTSLVAEMVTDSSGMAVSAPLEAGRRYFIEEILPAGLQDEYVAIDLIRGYRASGGENIAVTSGDGILLQADTTLALNVINEPFVSYSFTKTDSASGDAVVDGKAEFALYDADPAAGAQPVATGIRADKSGKVTFTGLVPGAAYWYVETTAPDGYAADSAPVRFTAPRYTQTGDLPEFPNDREIELTVLKTGEFDGVSKQLAGAKFALYPSSLTAAPGEEQLQDAFEADKAAAQAAGLEILTGATGTNGKVTVSGLAPGCWWLVETEAPEGYALNTTPIFLTISKGGEQQSGAYTYKQSVEVFNEANTGALEIEKINKVTGKTMDGVEFTLYKANPDGTAVEPVSAKTTGSNGRAGWTLLAPGEYLLVETVPDGFAAAAQTPVKIEAGKTTSLTGSAAIENQPLGKIRILKNALWAGVSGQPDFTTPLAGAVFEVLNSKGEVVASGLTTGEDGTVETGWLPDGVYTIRETQAPDGFTADPNPQTVTVKVTANQWVFETEPFLNTHELGRIRILKTDNASPAHPLSGATFRLWLEVADGVEDPQAQLVEVDFGGHVVTKRLRLVTTVTTGKDGYAISDPLPLGQYYVEETVTPDGYTYINRWSGAFSVTAGQIYDAQIVNVPVADGPGVKFGIGANGSSVLAGAYIALFENENDAVNALRRNFTAAELDPMLGVVYDGLVNRNEYGIRQVVKSGGDGVYRFTDLDTTKNYYVVELLAPAGYVRDSGIYPVSAVEKEGQLVFEMPDLYNERFGSIEIYKLYYMSGNPRPLEGAVFELFYAIPEQNADEKELAKEVNKVWNANSSLFEKGAIVTNGLGDLQDSASTAANGSLVFGSLDPGYYLIHETQAPAGFQPSGEYYLVQVLPGGVSSYFTGGNAIVNTTDSLGEFTLDKVLGDENGKPTNTRLSAVFEIQRKEGGAWVSYELPSGYLDAQHKDRFRTDAKAPYVSAPVPAGDYRVREVSAPGSNYTLRTEWFEFTVTVGKTTAVGDEKGSDVIRNYKKGALNIVKYGVFENSEYTPLDGVVFELFADTNGNGQYDAGVDRSVGSKTTAAGGKAGWSGLDRGVYFLIEQSVGENSAYAPIGQPVKVEIKAGKTLSLNAKNSSNPLNNTAVYGKIRIEKIDQDSREKLEGAVFEIYTDAGCTGTPAGRITTGSDGAAVSPLLAPGSYWLKEVTAPDGYEDAQAVFGPVRVEANKTNTALTGADSITNKKLQTVEVVKVSSTDPQASKPVTSGTFVFELRMVLADGSEQLIETKSSKNGSVNTGIVRFTNLMPGTTYRIYEKSAAAGYVKRDDYVEIVTRTDGKVQQVLFENDPMGKVQLRKVTVWDDGEIIPLAGATFQMYKTDGTPVGAPFVSDADGVATSGWLEAGDYYFVETASPNADAFEIVTENGAPKQYPVTVEKGQINTAYTSVDPDNLTAIQNTALWGRFAVRKFASGTTTALSGATFALYAYQGSGDPGAIENYSFYSAGQAYQSDHFTVSGATIGGVFEPGAYLSGYLPAGRYAIIETAAPSGYTLDATPHFFEVSIRHTVEITVYNDAKGELKVIKTSSEDGAPISGVEFELYKGEVTGSTTLELLGNPISTQRTDSSGVTVFRNLDAGTYALRESLQPAGYALNTRLYTVVIPQSGTVTVTEQKVENDPSMGVGYIFKYEQKLFGKTGLEGAKFELYYDAALTRKVEEAGVLTTDSTGYAVTPMLAPGQYWVKEIEAPTGFTLDDRYVPTVKTLVIKAVHRPDLEDENKRVNYVEFENVRAGEPAGMPTSLVKTAEPAVLSESLMLAESSVRFTLSDFATGKNDLPMKNFTLTDTELRFLDSDGNAIKAGKGEYSFSSLIIGRAWNQDAPDSEVTARVSYQLNGQVDGSGNPVWSGDTTEITGLQKLDAAGYTVTLPAHTDKAFVTGVKIEYFGTGANFQAEDVILDCALMQRAGGSTVKEAVKLENTARLSYTYDSKDNTGAESTVTRQASSTASVGIPSLSEDRPVVKLTNKVDGGATRAHNLGDTLKYTVTAENTSKTPFEDPVIVIEVPAYTTLDMDSIQITGPDGRPLGALSNAESPAVVESTVVDGVMTQRLVFSFPGVTLGKGEKITVTYNTVIDLTTPRDVAVVTSPAWLSSDKRLPATADNPLGTSFINHSTNNKPATAPAVDKTVNPITGLNKPYEYLNANAAASIVHSDQVSIVKQQKNSLDTDFKNAGQLVYVHPDGNIDYKLIVVNNLSDPVRNLRLVDLLPVYGDSYVKRNSSSGTAFDRGTEIPERPVLTGPITADSPAQDATVTVWYSVAAWDAACRTAAWPGAQGVVDELPMLYRNDGKTADTWSSAGWMTEAELLAAGYSWSDVTGVGIEVEYADGALMRSGDQYTFTFSMKMPGFTADEIADFYDKKIANSAAASLRPENTENPWVVENVRVISYLRLPTGSIGDYAFYDNDNDGIQSSGDQPITGLGVTLLRTDNYPDGSSNRAIYNTVTDENGKYLFDNLPCNYLKAGAKQGSTDPNDYVGEVYTTYDVVFDNPVKTDADGNVLLTYAPTLQNQGTDDALDSDINSNGRVSNVTLDVVEDASGVLVGEQDLTIDAGYVAPCALGNYVWLDTDRDGIQGESGTGVPNAVVRLYRVSGTTEILSGTTMTDENGYYLFDNLVPGTYVVEFDISSLVKSDGYTYQYAFTKTLEDPTDAQSQVDSDAKHTMDADDRIRRTDPVTLRAGDEYLHCDAGLTVYSALGGFIFDDRNYNDRQDLMYPLAGTKVTLYGSKDGAIDESTALGEVTVDGTGRFYFDNLIEGTYYLKYDFPDGYTAVNARAALVNGVNDPTLDSNCEANLSADRNVGYSAPIVLPADTADTTWDAGARKYGAIGDYVWFDENRDGVQDASESGVEGVDVVLQSRVMSTGSLTSGQWQFEQRAVTDADGYYLFTGLRGGIDANVEYRVLFLPDEKYEITSLDQGGDDALDSDAQTMFVDGLGYPTDTIRIDYGETDLTWDAGLVTVSSALGDFVWYDANRNGLQDDGEAVLKGVLCILEKNGTGDLDNPNAWVEVARMYTGDDGRYRFDDLAEGYYRVVIGIPNVYSVTRLERGSSNEVDSDAIYQTASAVATIKGAAGLLRMTGFALTVADPDVTPFGTKVIDHTGAENTVGVTYYKTRTVYLEKNTVDLTWDVGVYTVQTGDAGSAVMWIGIACMSMAAMVVLWYLLNRRRLRGEE